jgi:ketosteroid isomerase-like protein
MNEPLESQIIECEERLRSAMLNSDVDTLDELLAPDLIFTSHLGQLWKKEDDLAAHRSGAIKIEQVNVFDRQIRLVGEVAIAWVGVYISGSIAENKSAGNFRFTRIWARSSDDRWQVVTAHSCMVM